MVHKSATAISLAVAISGCVVRTGPASEPPPAPQPYAAPAPAPSPAPTPASSPPPVAVAPPAPAQPVFVPTPEPRDRPAEHARGIARGAPRGLQPGHPEALWVWHDDDGSGWHVRSTTHSQRHRFSGRVWVADGSVANVNPSRLEFRDRLHIGPRFVEFDFETDGGIDGFDFRSIGAKCVHFALFVDGRGDPGKVKVGAGEAHPRHHVFTLCP